MLTAILTKPVIPIAISNIEDLVSQTDYGWYLEDGAMIVQLTKAGKKGSTFRWK